MSTIVSLKIPGFLKIQAKGYLCKLSIYPDYDQQLGVITFKINTFKNVLIAEFDTLEEVEAFIAGYQQPQKENDVDIKNRLKH